jgi:[ribosomal protein S5]-alanine N-acetyltransferase
LSLHPVAAADVESLHAVFIQPGVRRFVFDGQIIARELTQQIVERSAALSAERGLGLWLARANPAAAGSDSHAIVGFGGFWHFREPPELELLYGVADACIGRGYGLEIARGVVQYGFDALRMPVIRASTDAGHLASQRILDRLGFVCERREVVHALDTMFYSCATPRAVGAHPAPAAGVS